MREEQAQLRDRIATLEKQLQAVLDQLSRRANLTLAGLLSEHETLKAEYERVIGQALLGTSS